MTSVERPCLHCRRNDRLNCVNLRQSRQILRAGARVAAFKANEEGQTTKKSQRENERKKDDVSIGNFYGVHEKNETP